MTQGVFIAFEGGEGTGKSTQAKLLADHLKRSNHEVILTREPGGTPGAEAIRSLLLDPPGEGWNSRAEAMLFAAARSDHAEKLIRPSLNHGKWVICDRFLDSSRAYQGGAGGLGDQTITRLHEIGSEGLRPDLTVLIDVPSELVSRRLAKRDGGTSDAIGGRDADYHQAVATTFLSLAKKDPAGFVVIDGNADIEEVQSRVISALNDRLDCNL